MIEREICLFWSWYLSRFSSCKKNDISSGFRVAAFEIIKLKGVMPKEGWTLVLGTLQHIFQTLVLSVTFIIA